jgi:hypothetical protein
VDLVHERLDVGRHLTRTDGPRIRREPGVNQV